MPTITNPFRSLEEYVPTAERNVSRVTEGDYQQLKGGPITRAGGGPAHCAGHHKKALFSDA
ncbi:MAG: hypothetical protein WCB52_00425, partial [Pseudolabrys sp.]